MAVLDLSPCFNSTLLLPVLTSPLLGLSQDGCEDVLCAGGPGVGVHGSPYWLQLFQLLQLALPQHPAATTPPRVS